MKRVCTKVLFIGAIAALCVSILSGITGTNAADSGITVRVRSYVCPTDFDGAKASLADLSSKCMNPGSSQNLSYFSNGTKIDTVALDASGTKDLIQYPVGTAELELEPPQNSEARVFCGLIGGAPPAETPTQVPAPATPAIDAEEAPATETGQASESENGAGIGAQENQNLVLQEIQLVEYQNPPSESLTAGAQWTCYFYNYTVAGSKSSTLVVDVRNCAAGAEAYKDDLKSLEAKCAEGGRDGISFSLSDSTKAKVTKQTTNGTVTFANIVPDKPFTLQESFPAGYGAASLFCQSVPPKMLGGEYQQFPVANGAAQLTAKPEYTLGCYWFNLQAPSITVKIAKYACPLGVEPPKDDPKEKKADDKPICAPEPDVKFTITSSGDQSNSIVQTTDQDGIVYSTGVKPGTIQIVETLPYGYAYPVVYCTIGIPEDQPTNKGIEVSNGGSAPAISFEAKKNAAAYCSWYNIAQPPATATPTPSSGGGGGNQNPRPTPAYTAEASGPASLSLEVHTCPADYDVLKSNANPKSDCQPTAAGVDFSLSGDSGDEKSQTTADNGRTTFNDLAAGEYKLAEEFPDEMESAFIGSCTSNVRDLTDIPFSPLTNPDVTGRFGIGLETGEQLSCVLYNVPSSDSASGATVTISLRDCPGQQASPAQCPPAGAGAQFTLSPQGDAGDAVSMTTNDSGIASGPVLPGMYSFAQVGNQACFTESDAFNSDGEFVVGDTDIEVTVYNCG